MQLNHHPDFCRTIKYHDRARRGRQQIMPTQKFMDAWTKMIDTIRIYTHTFSYHVTKGWRAIARNWRGI